MHTLSTEGIFSKTLPPPKPLWKFQQSFIHFFQFFGLTEAPTPQEIPVPSVGGVWMFSGPAHCVKCCLYQHARYCICTALEIKKNIALALLIKKINTIQHFSCTVNIMFSIKMTLNKILTSFCCKITVSFRDIEIQNFHFDVTGRPSWEITYTSILV